MVIKHARFDKSSSKLDQCPKSDKPEFAFIGRSNVGKSSLINMLTERVSLAKTSSKPGKTQLINHFEINEEWYLVDLPGYGWSKVSKQKKEDWGVMIEEYLLRRENMACLFVLIDSRLEPQDIDYEFIQWLGKKEIPFVLVFTKIDKMSKNKFSSVKAGHVRRLKKEWEELPEIFETSSTLKTGRAEVLNFISGVIENFNDERIV